MDPVQWLAAAKNIGAGGFVAFIVFMMLTDRLVWRGRLTKVEKQRDDWQRLALDLLGVADRMTSANEHALTVVDTKLPPQDLVAKALERTVGGSPDEPPEGGGFREAARLAAEAAARRLRGEG